MGHSGRGSVGPTTEAEEAGEGEQDEAVEEEAGEAAAEEALSSMLADTEEGNQRHDEAGDNEDLARQAKGLFDEGRDGVAVAGDLGGRVRVRGRQRVAARRSATSADNKSLRRAVSARHDTRVPWQPRQFST